MPCISSYFQVYLNKRLDGAVVLKESVTKLRVWAQGWGFEPQWNLYFYFLLSQRSRTFFRDLHFCRKKHVLMYYAHEKWRGLYGDTATMPELLLKTWTSSAWRKRCLEWICHWTVYGTGLQHSLALADLPLRKLWKRRRRHMTSNNNQSNHRHLRRKCHWMTLTRLLYGEPSPKFTALSRFCQPLITSE